MPPLQFVNRAGAAGLKLSSSGKVARLVVSKDLPGGCTISTSEPLKGPGKKAFAVSMPTKGVRTAVGFTEQPAAEYMTPDYRRDRGYVSMGGAGFIYPAKAMSRATYGEGDTVRCELCFDSRRVTFWVNGKEAGSAGWAGGQAAYPAVSVFPGDLVCEVRFE